MSFTWVNTKGKAAAHTMARYCVALRTLSSPVAVLVRRYVAAFNKTGSAVSRKELAQAYGDNAEVVVRS